MQRGREGYKRPWTVFVVVGGGGAETKLGVVVAAAVTEYCAASRRRPFNKLVPEPSSSHRHPLGSGPFLGSRLSWDYTLHGNCLSPLHRCCKNHRTAILRTSFRGLALSWYAVVAAPHLVTAIRTTTLHLSLGVTITPNCGSRHLSNNR